MDSLTRLKRQHPLLSQNWELQRPALHEEKLRWEAGSYVLNHLSPMPPAELATRENLEAVEARLCQKANLIDLSRELHFVAQIEHKMYEVQQEVRSVLCTMPSCSYLFFYRRPCSQVISLVNEVNQHLLQCAQFQEDTDINFPSKLADLAIIYAVNDLPGRMGDICRMEFVTSIVRAVVASIAIRLLKERYVLKHREMQLLRYNRPDFKALGQGQLDRLREFDVAVAKAEGDRSRTEFLDKAQLKPPSVIVRVIDCKKTCEKKQVVLRDLKDAHVQAKGYSAISHTYGQAVYSVFNCTCATTCLAEVPRCDLDQRCPHDAHGASDAARMKHREVVQDILSMCSILKEAGVRFAWHDGVCIAQHKDSEVNDTIEHIGWIYSNAKETIIFLHYVGWPMAPIRPGKVVDEMTSRWQTRVWTLQEAALSKCRRYCVRVGSISLDNCESLEDFEMKLHSWYIDGFSKVEIIEEERFYEIVKSMYLGLSPWRDVEEETRIWLWGACLEGLLHTLRHVCFRFPTIGEALKLCSTDRDSKHKGDRINSILTLAEVTGFVAAKDSNLEASTLEFFKRQGGKGLAWALFATNTIVNHEGLLSDYAARRHTWLPLLSAPLRDAFTDVCQLEDVASFKVTREEMLKVRAENLAGLKVRFIVKRNLPDEVESAAAGAKEEFDFDDTSFGLKSIEHDHVLNLEMKCDGHVIFVTPSKSFVPVGTLEIPYMIGFEYESPTIDGKHPLQHGETFLAHLVLFVDHGFDKPLLVVQGESLHGEVSKIGLFRPMMDYNVWLAFLRNLRDSDEYKFTYAERIIIK